MRKAFVSLILLSLLLLLLAACKSGAEGTQASAVDTSKLKNLGQKERANLENKLLAEMVSMNPDSVGNGRVFGRLVNLADKEFAAVEISAVVGKDEQRVAGRTIVTDIKKAAETPFSIRTAIPQGEITQLGLKLKVEKVMVAR